MNSETDGSRPKLQRVEGHSEDRFLGSDVFESSGRNIPPPNGTGTIREAARDIDIYHQCDVAVIEAAQDQNLPMIARKFQVLHACMNFATSNLNSVSVTIAHPLGSFLLPITTSIAKLTSFSALLSAQWRSRGDQLHFSGFDRPRRRENSGDLSSRHPVLERSDLHFGAAAGSPRLRHFRPASICALSGQDPALGMAY